MIHTTKLLQEVKCYEWIICWGWWFGLWFDDSCSSNDEYISKEHLDESCTDSGSQSDWLS